MSAARNRLARALSGASAAVRPQPSTASSASLAWTWVRSSVGDHNRRFGSQRGGGWAGNPSAGFFSPLGGDCTTDRTAAASDPSTSGEGTQTWAREMRGNHGGRLSGLELGVAARGVQSRAPGAGGATGEEEIEELHTRVRTPLGVALVRSGGGRGAIRSPAAASGRAGGGIAIAPRGAAEREGRSVFGEMMGRSAGQTRWASTSASASSGGRGWDASDYGGDAGGGGAGGGEGGGTYAAGDSDFDAAEASSNAAMAAVASSPSGGVDGGASTADAVTSTLTNVAYGSGGVVAGTTSTAVVAEAMTLDPASFDMAAAALDKFAFGSGEVLNIASESWFTTTSLMHIIEYFHVTQGNLQTRNEFHILNPVSETLGSKLNP